MEKTDKLKKKKKKEGLKIQSGLNARCGRGVISGSVAGEGWCSELKGVVPVR